MLGGGSIIAILLGVFLTQSNPSPYTLLVGVTLGNFFVTYPHFAFSYFLFYSGFYARLRSPETTVASRVRLMLAGVIVPLVMAASLGACYFYKNEHLLQFLVIAMFFLTGWHYAKQGYGTLITLSVYRDIFYTAREKIILTANAYSVWLFAWACATVEPHNFFHGLSLTFFTVPKALALLLGIGATLTTFAVVDLFADRFLADRKNFPVNGVLGYLASLYFWTMLVGFQTWAVFVLIPAFHSLQYLFFVWKFKAGEKAASGQAQTTAQGKIYGIIALIFFILGGWLLGTFFMDFLPKRIDALHISPLRQVVGFFLVSFLTFINIHHYFMDSAFWRRDNAKVQQYLFKAQ